VVIMLVLAGITVATINITIDGDKVRSAARQIQSYIEGARSRASDAKAPRGVRFILDPTDPRTVSSMVYIAPTDPWNEGTVYLTRADDDNDYDPVLNDGDDPFNGVPPYNDSNTDVWMLVGFDGALTSTPFSASNPAQATNWLELYQRGVLRDGNRIQIPAGTGAWYTVDVRYLRKMDQMNLVPSATNRVRILLQQKYRTPAETPATSYAAFSGNKPVRYLLELTPGPLANQEPIQLPKGAVVHLDRCSSDPDGLLDANGNDPTSGSYGGPTRNPALRGNRLPSTWRRPHTPASPAISTPPDPSGFDYSPYCDILFSPRGSVTGPEASTGLIHLYVADQKDADRDRSDWKIAAPASGNWSAPEYQEGVTASDPSGNPHQRGDKLIVSIFTRTGSVTTNPLFVNGNGSENVAQRFRYSETGEVAGK
jgi:hypothetical protein